MSPIEGGTTSSRLRDVYSDKYDVIHFQKRFHQKYPCEHPFPQFAWQPSFHDHFIRNKRDFNHHLRYIIQNPDKHGLPENWPYVSTDSNFNDLVDDI